MAETCDPEKNYALEAITPRAREIMQKHANKTSLGKYYKYKEQLDVDENGKTPKS